MKTAFSNLLWPRLMQWISQGNDCILGNRAATDTRLCQTAERTVVWMLEQKAAFQLWASKTLCSLLHWGFSRNKLMNTANISRIGFQNKQGDSHSKWLSMAASNLAFVSWASMHACWSKLLSTECLEQDGMRNPLSWIYTGTENLLLTWVHRQINIFNPFQV